MNTPDGGIGDRQWICTETRPTHAVRPAPGYHHQPQRLTLDPSAAGPIDASVACVERIIAEDRTAYGINTGFGLLASTRIAREDLEALQSSLVLSRTRPAWASRWTTPWCV